MLRIVVGLVAVAAVACGEPHGAPADAARADAARDAPAARHDASDVVTDAAHDVRPTVDVTLFDASALDAPYVPPPADAAADAAAYRCGMLADQYAAQLRDASRCATRSDCAALVCETPCCTCQVFANASPAALESLMRTLAAWRAAGCAAGVTCGTTTCDPAAAAECSSTERCTTIRRPSSGG